MSRAPSGGGRSGSGRSANQDLPLVLAGGAGICYLGQATYWAVAADYGGPYTGIISGLINMAGQISGAVTASLTPLLAQWYGWEHAFYVAAGICFVCMFPWFVVNPNRRLRVEEDEQVIA